MAYNYENLYDFDSESVNTLFEPVVEMIEKIKKEIENTL